MASAPGKTILMGEHAVVYGAPAVVAAVDLRARAAVAEDASVPAGRVALELPDLDHLEVLAPAEVVAYARRARERWEVYHRSSDRGSFDAVRGERPDHVALVALGEAMLAARAARPGGDGAGPGPRGRPVRSARGERSGAGVRLEVRSGIPVGRGFGSSAAVGAAVASAWLAREGVEPSRDALEDLLLEVERRQHGDPSGVDAAAVLHGGLVWAAPAEGEEGRRFEEARSESDILERFRLVDTGPPAESTGEVVAAVRERRRSDPESTGEAIDSIREATLRFRDQLGRPGASSAYVSELIRDCQRALEGLGVVPEPVRDVVRAVEDEGGAAKISGAGALTSPDSGPPGGGLLLVFHPRPERMREWPFLEDLDVLDVRLGVGGTRVEEAG